MVTIVLDTNSLIAARWNRRSSSLKIIQKCIAGEITVAYTSQVKDENLLILSKVKAPADYMDLIERFYGGGILVESKGRIKASIDDSDNRFLEAAVAADADYVISNDSHLLDLKEHDGIRILRPSEFIRMFA